ncbi:MAG: M48 family metalloprotease, partial [Acidobacteriia bacterium]|nr:M48 family metalloprotease [Terriglobia bacterium]
ERKETPTNVAKNEARYEKLKQYSLDKYQADPDFRDEVDQAFEDLMRQHSDRAYQKNVSISSHIASVREDRWRVHENLYDNLLVQDHINRIGQKLVPPESERLFAFKVIPEPTPVAETLATGTVYISTGLISLLDSEAQLAYVLAHEAGHIQLDHWKERVMLDRGQAAYAEEQQKKAARISLVSGLLGAGLGGAIGRSAGAVIAGGATGAAAGLIAGELLNRPLVVNWDRAEEDAADEYALKAVLAASYDVREVPNLYVTMQKVAVRDARIGLGFLGSRKRIEERMEKSKDLIANAYKADIEVKLKSGFLNTSAEHRNLMAELKRDNGIMAYYRDMFDLARTNLADATAIRDNDPAAHYFYGKVLKLVGRNPEDEKASRDEFYKAAKADKHDENFGSHLHLALMLAREKDPDRKLVTQELDEYVTDYARWNITDRTLRAFPPNLDSIYEYMTLYGDPGWMPKPPDIKDLNTLIQFANGAPPSIEPPAPKAAQAAPATPAPAPTKPSIPLPGGTKIPVPVAPTGVTVPKSGVTVTTR